ncbi:MAG TPA: hypothetical protein VJ160_02470 [Anaerolineales bacterium]|nr:hypothetical protein [Anaerolineales bacterium]
MGRHALFGGLVIDEDEQPVPVVSVGDEAFYVVDDDGFRRHIESERVDRQVLEHLRRNIEGHEETISRGTMQLLGQDDIFTKAAIEASLRNLDAQFDELMGRGLPEDARAWLGMMGFRVVIDVHGDVVRVEEPPGAPEGEE